MTVCRQGLLNIPCLLLMNWSVGLYGMIWTQLIIETLMPVSYTHLDVYKRQVTDSRPEVIRASVEGSLKRL